MRNSSLERRQSAVSHFVDPGAALRPLQARPFDPSRFTRTSTPSANRASTPAPAAVTWTATTDPEQIRQWCDRWPNANISIPTGKRSGLLSLDVDTHNWGAWRPSRKYTASSSRRRPHCKPDAAVCGLSSDTLQTVPRYASAPVNSGGAWTCAGSAAMSLSRPVARRGRTSCWSAAS
jgi:hypothetical protein